MKVKKGQIVAFSEGEYSDYTVEALCVVDNPFDLEEMKNKWMDECCEELTTNIYKHRPERKLKSGKPSFLAWLSMKMLVTDIDYIEVHTGSYGEVDVTFDLVNHQQTER